MIKPSISTLGGSRNLFSLEDVYLLALAYELSKAGLTAQAISKLLEGLKARLPGRRRRVKVFDRLSQTQDGQPD